VSARAVDREVRQDVADLLVRYASGIDRRDWKLLRSCFTDDCVADYGDIGRWNSGDEITEWMRTTHEPLGHTLHRITNQAVARDGTSYTARSYVDVIVLGPGNVGGAQAAGYYDDVVVQTEEGWKIARRRYTMVRLQGIEPAGDEKQEDGRSTR
jgi:3-phenylpropionate/cinnamic acid dioxygenase small subunit